MQLCLPGGFALPRNFLLFLPRGRAGSSPAPLPRGRRGAVSSLPSLPRPLWRALPPLPAPRRGLCLLRLPGAAGSAFSACPETGRAEIRKTAVASAMGMGASTLFVRRLMSFSRNVAETPGNSVFLMLSRASVIFGHSIWPSSRYSNVWSIGLPRDGRRDDLHELVLEDGRELGRRALARAPQEVLELGLRDEHDAARRGADALELELARGLVDPPGRDALHLDPRRRGFAVVRARRRGPAARPALPDEAVHEILPLHSLPRGPGAAALHSSPCPAIELCTLFLSTNNRRGSEVCLHTHV